MDTDAQYLRLLSIFHYVVGGLAGCFGCFPFIYVGLGIAMLSGAFDEQGKQPPPPFVGWILIAIGAFIIVAVWTFALCLMLAGHWLGHRKHYWFCLVMGCVACVFSPFGTVLGVFTIIVLLRPAVKALFGLVLKTGRWCPAEPVADEPGLREERGQRHMADAPSLQFLGAAGTVTGSKHLVRANSRQVLLDCGLFQGLKELRLRNWRKPPVRRPAIDAVLLSHAHIDHSGGLPLLVRNGFRGSILCTSATADLLPVLSARCGPPAGGRSRNCQPPRLLQAQAGAALVHRARTRRPRCD